MGPMLITFLLMLLMLLLLLMLQVQPCTGGHYWLQHLCLCSHELLHPTAPASSNVQQLQGPRH